MEASLLGKFGSAIVLAMTNADIYIDKEDIKSILNLIYKEHLKHFDR